MAKSDYITIGHASELYGLTASHWARLVRVGLVRGEKRPRGHRPGGSLVFLDPDSVKTYIVAQAREWERKRRAALETSTARSRRPRAKSVNGTLVPLSNADRHGLALSTVKHLAADGVIAAEKRGDLWRGRWFVDEDDIAAYAQELGQRSSVDDWGLRLFQEHLLARGYTHDTSISYPQHVIPFLRWAEQRGIEADRATADEVASFYVSSLDRLAHNTAYVQVKALRVYFEWMRGRGVRPDNPVDGIKPRRTKTEARQPFTDDELRALLAAADRSPSPLRDRALLLLFISTGLRRGEMGAIETDDIDWQRGLILVRHGKGDRQRLVAPGVAALKALKDYIAERRGHVWLSQRGAPMDGKGLYRRLRRIGRWAGVDEVYAHKLRTTFANRWLDQGGDLVSLQGRMGHANIEQTAHYGRFNSDRRGLEIQATMLDSLLTDGQDPTPTTSPPAPAAIPEWLRRVREPEDSGASGVSPIAKALAPDAQESTISPDDNRETVSQLAAVTATARRLAERVAARGWAVIEGGKTA